MFNPNLQSTLDIDGHTFQFSPHPVVPSLVWGQEGRHAIVYRMTTNGRGPAKAYALKVFRPVFRHAGLIEAVEAMAWYQELPGMRVCAQQVLTPETHPRLIAQHEDLDHAMLMPWIEGETWFDYLQKRQRVTLDQSRALAESVAWVLYALELNQIAHCDLSSGNVIVDDSLEQVNLIDVEDLYSPWLEPPPFVPAGSIGYAHRSVQQDGQWGPLGDRFSGAVLVAEMLIWAKPDLRMMAHGESFFDPAEMHDPGSERYHALRDMLRVFDPAFAEAFEQAWRSRTLNECPPLKTWYDLLDGLPREPVASWAPINPREFEANTPRPKSVAVGAGRAASKAGLPVDTKKRGRLGQWAQNISRSLGVGCNVLLVAGALISFITCFIIVALMTG